VCFCWLLETIRYRWKQWMARTPRRKCLGFVIFIHERFHYISLLYLLTITKGKNRLLINLKIWILNIAGKNVRPIWRHIQHYYKCYAMLYVNILYNDIIILHITLIEKLWNVDPPLFSAWSAYEPISSLEMLTIVNTLLLT
jgi:hypothetical protein